MRYIVFILLGALFSSPVSAEIFMYKDANGVIMLTDKPRDGYRPSQVRKEFAPELETHYDIIKTASSRYKVDPELVSAVVSVESNFDELAISKKGAMGLMQLMPDTADQLGVIDPFDPEDNIDGGVKYLRYLIERFKGDLTLAVAAYNAGPTNVEKYGGIPPINETINYVKKVFAQYKGSKRIDLDQKRDAFIQRVVLNDGRVIYTNKNAYALTTY